MQLICAVADYARDGSITEVPQELKTIYVLLKNKQAKAKEQYEKLCNTKREHGSKGGKMKALNAAKAKESQSTPKFKPPTLTQFKNAVKALSDSEEIDSDYFDIHDVESFYDELKENNWRIGTAPIVRRVDWEDAIKARFCYDNACDRRRPAYELFRFAFSRNYRDEEGCSLAYSMVMDFSDTNSLNQSLKYLTESFEQFLAENCPP